MAEARRVFLLGIFSALQQTCFGHWTEMVQAALGREAEAWRAVLVVIPLVYSPFFPPNEECWCVRGSSGGAKPAEHRGFAVIDLGS